MKNRTWRGITALALVLSMSAAALALTGDEILAKVDGVLASKATIMEAVMTTGGGGAAEKSSQMIIYTKEDAAGKTKTMIKYVAPAADKGTAFLSLGSVDQMWMYLPKVEKLVRIAGSMVKQSMMNSDFSYQDLMSRGDFGADYAAKLVGNEKIGGDDCYVMELSAKKGSAQYRRIKLWVRQDNFIPIKEEFYSGGGTLAKVAEQGDLKVFDGRVVSTRIVFRDMAQKGHQTVLTIKSIKFNADIPDRYFTVQYLEKGQ